MACYMAFFIFTFFKYGKQKPNINSITIHLNKMCGPGITQVLSAALSASCKMVWVAEWCKLKATIMSPYMVLWCGVAQWGPQLYERDLQFPPPVIQEWYIDIMLLIKLSSLKYSLIKVQKINGLWVKHKPRFTWNSNWNSPVFSQLIHSKIISTLHKKSGPIKL